MVKIRVGSEYWQIYNNGWISQICSDGFAVVQSEQWRATGAIEYNNFGKKIKEYSLEDILSRKVPWLFKNGKQRCFLAQFDHGTYNQLGSQSHQVY